MDPYALSLLTGASFIVPVALGLVTARLMVSQAKDRIARLESKAEDEINAQAHDCLEYMRQARAQARALNERARGAWLERDNDEIVALCDENQSLEAMVGELREERDNLSTELAAAKIDASETDRVADAYAKQSRRLDRLVSHLTQRLDDNHLDAGITDGNLYEDHCESLIRTGIATGVGRGPRAAGRATDLALAA